MVYFVQGMPGDIAWDVRRHLSGHYILTECPREKGLWVISYLEALHVVSAVKVSACVETPPLKQFCFLFIGHVSTVHALCQREVQQHIRSAAISCFMLLTNEDFHARAK
eukprot:5832614-Amphidinium_carterae.1